jgi:hypothetical protein
VNIKGGFRRKLGIGLVASSTSGEIQMKVFWWQAGLHFEPQNKEDSEALVVIAEALNVINVDQGVQTGPISGHLANQDSVSGVHMRS